MANSPITASQFAVPKTKELAAIGLFGALSIILSIISNNLLKLSFIPPVSYLLFDFGEIPVVVCFLLIGPKAGVGSAAVEFVALNMLPTTLPVIGPLFKVLSVLTTISGLWLVRFIPATFSMKSKISIGSGIAILTRVCLMTVPNFLLLTTLFAMPLGSALFYFLYLTAIFNGLHVVFDLIPSYLIIRVPQIRHALRSNGTIWFEIPSLGKKD